MTAAPFGTPGGPKTPRAAKAAPPLFSRQTPPQHQRGAAAIRLTKNGGKRRERKGKGGRGSDGGPPTVGRRGEGRGDRRSEGKGVPGEEGPPGTGGPSGGERGPLPFLERGLGPGAEFWGVIAGEKNGGEGGQQGGQNFFPRAQKRGID